MTGGPVSSSNKLSSANKAALLVDLQDRIAGIERVGGAVEKNGSNRPWGVVPLGVVDLDNALPNGGLTRGRLHEVASIGVKGKDGKLRDARLEGDVAALGFAAALVGRAAGTCPNTGGAVLWCTNRKSLYHAGSLHGPGLSTFGVDARRLVLIDGTDDTQVLWAMEEGLRSGALSAVAGEVGNLTSAASRRLQLAAEAGGGLGLLVRVSTKKAAKTVTAATTRWEISVAESVSENVGASLLASRRVAQQTFNGLGPARWDVRLARCRGGSERNWRVEWNHETHRFAVVAPVASQPAVPGAASEAGENTGQVVVLPRCAVE